MEKTYGKVPNTNQEEGIMGVVTLINPVKCFMPSLEEWVFTNEIWFTSFTIRNNNRVYKDYLGLWVEVENSNVSGISYVPNCNEISLAT